MKLLVVGDFQGNFPERLRKRITKEKFNAIIGVGDYGGIAEWRPWVMKNLNDSKKGKPYLTAEEYFGKKGLRRIIAKDEKATKTVFRKIDSLNRPFIFVFGNGDDGWYRYPFTSHLPKLKKSLAKFLQALKNSKDITYKKGRVGNINFIGFGGYMDIDAYFDRKTFPEAADRKRYGARMRRRLKSKKNLFSRLRKVKGAKVFVFHYPPKGVFDIIKDKKDNPMNGKSAGIGFFRDAIRKYKPRLVLCGHMHEYQGAKKLSGSIVINSGDAEKGKYAVVEIPEGKGKINVKFAR
jgi:Icc-related predicted phosphoesterase